MKKAVYKTWRIRPVKATPELAVKLHEDMSLQEIANAWGISKQRVWQLIKQAEKKAQERELRILQGSRGIIKGGEGLPDRSLEEYEQGNGKSALG